MSMLVAVHLLAAVVWVGGMAFAYVFLRPAVSALEPPARCRLWSHVLAGFFRAVWVSVALLLATGYAMIFGVYGSMAAVGWHVHLMQGVGILMMLLFGHVYFGPFRRLRSAVAAEDWADAGTQIGRIRRVVATNLALGFVVVAVASGGRYL